MQWVPAHAGGGANPHRSTLTATLKQFDQRLYQVARSSYDLFQRSYLLALGLPQAETGAIVMRDRILGDPSADRLGCAPLLPALRRREPTRRQRTYAQFSSRR